MKRAYYWIKSVVLFLFGIVLVVWGYQVNASNSDKKKVEKAPEPSSDTEENDTTEDENEAVADQKEPTDSVSDNTKKAETPKAPEKAEEKSPEKSRKKAKKAKKVTESKKKEKEETQQKTEIESEHKAEESSATK